MAACYSAAAWFKGSTRRLEIGEGMGIDGRVGALKGTIERAGPGRDVRLLAVSKARSAGEVEAGYGAGLVDFGENYLQEAVGKMAALGHLPLVWHFVGAIQSNKTRDIASRFQWVHTVDRARIASRLDAAARQPIDVCIQVNIDAEGQKAGVAPAEAGALVGHILALKQLRLRGLMAIPRPGGDGRDSFRRTRALFEALRPQAGRHWDTLSMGMSGDFETAIEEGATIVRIGTAIFGPRPSAGERPSARSAASRAAQ